MAYLVSKYARNDSLYPKDTKERAKVDQMMYFDGGTLFPNVFKCYVRIDFYSKILLINTTKLNLQYLSLMKLIFLANFYSVAFNKFIFFTLFNYD